MLRLRSFFYQPPRRQDRQEEEVDRGCLLADLILRPLPITHYPLPITSFTLTLLLQQS